MSSELAGRSADGGILILTLQRLQNLFGLLWIGRLLQLCEKDLRLAFRNEIRWLVNYALEQLARVRDAILA